MVVGEPPNRPGGSRGPGHGEGVGGVARYQKSGMR